MGDTLFFDNNNIVITKIDLPPSTIYFRDANNAEIMRLEPNGDIFIHGRFAESDKHVVNGLREFLMRHDHLNYNNKNNDYIKLTKISNIVRSNEYRDTLYMRFAKESDRDFVKARLFDKICEIVLNE